MKKFFVLLPLVCAMAACHGAHGSPTSPTAALDRPSSDQPPRPAPTTAYPSNGPALVAYVAAKYPERLAAGVSPGQRLQNMEFLRDRIIEAGLCGGMNVAWNLKRGVGPHSIDAIDWRHGAQDSNDVVDLASDYDNTSHALQLHWVVTDGPAGWDPFPAPSCG
ncbi:MAG TPA: hypothetical protein VFX12_12985 [Vicinamibacterales bacterium]|nr:hypothetical protein [Vicinamibacterales bacterium]